MESKNSENADPNKKYRLLGDLPALGPNKGKDKVISDRDVDVALNLELNVNKGGKHEFMKNVSHPAESKQQDSPSSKKANPSIPKVRRNHLHTLS